MTIEDSNAEFGICYLVIASAFVIRISSFS